MEQIKKHPLQRRHSMDSAISSLWEFYKQKFLPLFIISLVMSFIMQLLSTNIDYNQLQNTTDIQVMADEMKGMILPFTGIIIASLFFNLVISHYILFNPLNAENNLFTSLLQSLKYFIPYLVVIIFLMSVGSLLIALGLVVFIVGAIFSVIILVTVYLFIAPIMLSENTDIIQTIKRMVKLSYNNFWTNIGWVSILIVIIFTISIGLSAIILLPFTGDFVKTLTNPADSSVIMELAKNPVYIILSSVAGAVTLPLMPVFSYILYFNSVTSSEEGESSQQKDNNEGKVRVEDLYAKPYYEELPPEQGNEEEKLKS